MNTDYERVSKAIVFLQDHQHEQPDLETVAQHIGLSSSHFQRLFTRWAGISPRRFLQYLTLSNAKARIQHTQSLLDVTFDAGLSSPGRLHDLFVNVVAMTPGEYKSGGKDLNINYGHHETPFGPVLIATTEKGICACHFQVANAVSFLKKRFPAATLNHAPENTVKLADAVFNPLHNSQRHLTAHVKGTNFQIQVWQALLAIPMGGLVSYGHIANQLGKPGASRAVGSAIGKNPVAVLIPCHRVLRASGEIGGYRWSPQRKRALLSWEAANSPMQDP